MLQMRMASARALAADLATSANHVFIAGQLLDPDRSASVKFVRADAYFRPHAEFAAIGELRRCIVQDDCAIDSRQKPLRGSAVVGNDAIGMLRTVSRNMRNG